MLDTNVISEGIKPRPSSPVMDWINSVDEDRLFLSIIAFAEISRGISLLEKTPRRDRLERWVETDLTTRFEGRILAIERPIADEWGRLMAQSRARGHALDPMDAFVAATAQAYSLTLVTRNIRDFRGLGLDLLSPWEDSSG